MTKIYDKTSAIRKHGLTKYYLWKAENQSGNEVLTEELKNETYDRKGDNYW